MIRWPVLITIAFALVLVIYFRGAIMRQTTRRTDGTKILVPESEIRNILPRGATQPITEPKFIPLAETDFPDESLVVVLVRGADHRAYPYTILNWHEVVSDVIGGTKVAVTFSPLSGTSYAFERLVNSEELTFGSSGQLYKNNMLMVDSQTGSLWTQATGQAIKGVHAGSELIRIPADHMTLGEFKRRYPSGLVLAKPTGPIARDYDTDPYEDYRASATAIGIFGQNHSDSRLKPKTLVFGVEHEGTFKAYPLEKLPADGVIEDALGGSPILIESNSASSYQAAFLKKPDGSKGEQLIGTQAFWFAWSDFHPETEVYNKK
ncbi:DUF3179 domain-containing protein [Candidatus Berkelbacteria bacterium]|nr:DUF3179 domain-containing protein [Candidatus Berkelbacteria bacterium]